MAGHEEVKRFGRRERNSVQCNILLLFSGGSEVSAEITASETDVFAYLAERFQRCLHDEVEFAEFAAACV